MAPRLAGRYRVVGDVAPTPEAFVYVAEDLAHERPVTLLVLRPELAEDAEFVAAVQEQVLLLAKPECAHPAIAGTYECGVTDEGDVFIAVEPVSGRSLRDVLYERGAHDTPAALRLAIQVGEALETLHHAGVIHGELRPDCVLVVKADDGTEAVKLTGVEFTRARRTRRGVRLRDATLRPYLAPEQMTGTEVTEATDVHALGLLLGELLTGEPPRGVARQRRPPRGTPRPIARIMAKALDPRAARRYADASLMVNALWTAEGGIQKNTRVAVPAPEAARSSGSFARVSRASIGKAAAVVCGVVVLGVAAWAAQSDRVPYFRSHASVSEAPAAAPVAPLQTPATPLPRPAADPPAELASRPQPLPAAPEMSPARPETSAAKLDTSPAKVETPPVKLETPPAKVEAPVAKVETPPVKLETPPAKVETPPVKTETPPRAPASATAARPVAKAVVTPPARRAPEQRPADGDGAAIIDWLLKGRP